MHLRRAMLLFAIVLGLAAMAAALTRPHRRPAPRAAGPPPGLTRRETKPSTQVRFDLAKRPRTRTVELGQRAVVTVDVARPGQVELQGLGLTAAAEPLTPARFDLLPLKAGRYDVLFTQAGQIASRRAGVLRVR